MAAKSSPPELSQEVISERARAIWIERGRPGGRDLEHWLDAERQLRDEFASRGRGRPSQPADNDDEGEAERRLDGLIEDEPSPARRTPAGEQL